MKRYNVPNELQPLSPWAYFGLTILFSVPVVGLVFLIIFAISGANINRRNFARSYFCVLAIILIAVLIGVVAGASSGIVNEIIGIFKK